MKMGDKFSVSETTNKRYNLV